MESVRVIAIVTFILALVLGAVWTTFRGSKTPRRGVPKLDRKVGIVGFAFGLRDIEPNPSNIVLAYEVASADEIVNFRDSMPVVVTQWEITKALNQLYGDWPIDHTVELHADGTYLSSKHVWEEAKEVFKREGVTQVILIAQPFLHLPSLKTMVKKDNFEILDYEVGPIPFDNERVDGKWLNTQAWTRSKIALFIYAIKSAIKSLAMRLLGIKFDTKRRQNAP